MRLQIDTTAKTIKVEQNIKLGELVDKLNALFPNNEWYKYTLETNTTIQNWSTPIIVRDYAPRTEPFWKSPFICDGTPKVMMKSVYNVEC